MIKGNVLTRGDGSLRMVKPHQQRAVCRLGDGASLILLAIADFGTATQRQNHGLQPICLTRSEPVASEVGCILGNQQCVTRGYFVHHIPRALRSAGEAAQINTLSLADRVLVQAPMLAKHSALAVGHGAGLIVNVLAEEVGKSTLADKTDASAVLLAVIGQSQRRCQTSYVGFLPIAQGKKTAREFVFRYGL